MTIINVLTYMYMHTILDICIISNRSFRFVKRQVSDPQMLCNYIITCIHLSL